MGLRSINYSYSSGGEVVTREITEWMGGPPACLMPLMTALRLRNPPVALLSLRVEIEVYDSFQNEEYITLCDELCKVFDFRYFKREISKDLSLVTISFDSDPALSWQEIYGTISIWRWLNESATRLDTIITFNRFLNDLAMAYVLGIWLTVQHGRLCRAYENTNHDIISNNIGIDVEQLLKWRSRLTPGRMVTSIVPMEAFSIHSFFGVQKMYPDEDARWDKFYDTYAEPRPITKANLEKLKRIVL